MKRIGVDVGGTFTGLYFSDSDDGRVLIEKVPSTPDEPARAVLNGQRLLCRKAGVELGCEGERHDSDPPWGVFGGHDGLNASLVRNPGRDDLTTRERAESDYGVVIDPDRMAVDDAATTALRAGRTT